MKLISISLTFLMVILAHGQKTKDLVREFTADLSSFKALEEKIKQYRTTNIVDTPLFMGYKIPIGPDKDEAPSFLNTKIFFDNIKIPKRDNHGKKTIKNDLLSIRIGYVSDKIVYYSLTLMNPHHMTTIKNEYDTLFLYLDTSINKEILGSYNSLHLSDFNWKDLFEDNCNSFSVVPGCCGTYQISEEAEPFLELIKTQNRPEILRNCKSFNPVRKAFGAVCLYVLQKDGEILANDEADLLESIRSSDELIAGSWGCLGFENHEISHELNNGNLTFYYKLIKAAIKQQRRPNINKQ